MELEGKRALVLIEDQFNDYEAVYPYYRLLEAGAQVTRVGTARGARYTGKHGLTMTADADAAGVEAKDYDAVVIPGGYAPDHMRRNQATIDLVREMYRQGKVVAAICHAGWVLASAGIVEGKNVTSFFSIRDDLVNAGAEWMDAEVVVDGNLITSRKPDDLPAFMRAIIGAMRSSTA